MSPRSSSRGAENSARVSTGMAIRRGDVKISDPVPFSFKHTTLTLDEQEKIYEGTMTKTIDGTWPRQTNSVQNHVRSQSSVNDLLNNDNRVSAGPSIGLNSIISLPSKTSSVQKKPSGLKATIRRMFGSKRNRPSLVEAHNDFRQSDPESLTFITEPQNLRDVTHRPPQSYRSLTEINPLRSHAPSASGQFPSSNVQDFEELTYLFKRRNTLPNLALPDHETQHTSEGTIDVVGVKQNPQRHQDDLLYQDKRRSRSAEALAARLNSHTSKSDTRPDRSAEIAYWRRSATLNPVCIPAHIMAAKPVKKRSKASVSEAPSHESAIQPIQDFDFGLDITGEGRRNVLDRVTTLEVKMVDFECALANLHGVDLAEAALPNKIMKRKSVHEVFPDARKRSVTSTTPVLTDTESSSPGRARRSPLVEVDNFAYRDRNSKSTIRASKSQGTLHRSTASTPESVKLSNQQFDNIVALLASEKKARQQMEMQLMDMKKEIKLLSAPIYAAIHPVHYSQSNPSSPVDASLTQRSKKLHRSPHFEFKKNLVHETSRFSMTESDFGSTDDSCQDYYGTPQEGNYSFGNRHDSSVAGMV